MTAESRADLIRLNMPPEARLLGETLAGWCDEAQPAYAADFAEDGLPVPQRCRTCAFRRGTMANGSLTTMVALKCVLEYDTFHCHEKDALTPDGQMLCVGYAIMVTADAKAKRPPIQCPWDVPEGVDVNAH